MDRNVYSVFYKILEEYLGNMSLTRSCFSASSLDSLLLYSFADHWMKIHIINKTIITQFPQKNIETRLVSTTLCHFQENTSSVQSIVLIRKRQAFIDSFLMTAGSIL